MKFLKSTWSRALLALLLVSAAIAASVYPVALAFLQAGFFLAGITAAIVAVLSIESGSRNLDLLRRHVGTLKKDASTRFERAAKEHAISTSLMYADVLELYGEDVNSANKAGVPAYYRGPVGKFGINTIPAQYVPSMNARLDAGVMMPSLNKLEAISASFVHGVADESVVFTMLSGAFCGIVREQYDILSHYESMPNSNYFSNIRQLYGIWSAKLERGQIEAEATNAMARLAATKDEQRLEHINPFREGEDE